MCHFHMLLVMPVSKTLNYQAIKGGVFVNVLYKQLIGQGIIERMGFWLNNASLRY
jgi:hypothetical protein